MMDGDNNRIDRALSRQLQISGTGLLVSNEIDTNVNSLDIICSHQRRFPSRHMADEHSRTLLHPFHLLFVAHCQERDHRLFFCSNQSINQLLSSSICLLFFFLMPLTSMWQSSNALESLRAAERRLIDLATSRFDRSISSNLEINPFDTRIPHSVVPLKHHKCHVYREEEDVDHFRIHALKISNKTVSAEMKHAAPLVMIHGYMNGAAYFYRNFSGLARYIQNIYSLDLLGWGLSSRPKFVLSDNKLKTAEDFFVESRVLGSLASKERYRSYDTSWAFPWRICQRRLLR